MERMTYDWVDNHLIAGYNLIKRKVDVEDLNIYVVNQVV